MPAMAAGGRSLDANDLQQLKKVRLRACGAPAWPRMLEGAHRVRPHTPLQGLQRCSCICGRHQSRGRASYQALFALLSRGGQGARWQGLPTDTGLDHQTAKNLALQRPPCAQRKAGGRMHSLGDVRSVMSGDGVPSRLSGSQSDDDDLEGQRLGGLDGDGEEGA